MRRLPPLGALEAFVVVAQRGTLKAASADLHLSISALSRRIQSLESHLGLPLFDRRDRVFRLTIEGQTLLDSLVPVFESMTHAFDSVRKDGLESLRIGVLPAFASGWLLPRLARFREAHPRLEVVLDTTPSPLSRLGTGLEAAIVLSDRPEEGLYVRPLPSQSLMAVCAPQLTRGPRAITSPQDLSQHTLLVHRDMPELLDAWLDGLDLRDPGPKAVEYYDSGPILLEAAAHGLGVALAFDFMVPELLASGRLVRPFCDHVQSPLNYFFACRPGAVNGRGLKAFHDWLFDELANDARTVQHPAEEPLPRPRILRAS
jgi:LysR family glycine cleavage system transcriptional activator